MIFIHGLFFFLLIFLSSFYPPYPWKKHLSPIIGVDEAGRGCLAGPVCAAAVILRVKKNISLFTDSKLLSASRREKLAHMVQSQHQVSVAFASVDEVTKLNILQASLLAMKRAVLNLGVDKGSLLIDGKHKISGISRSFKQTSIIKGDLRVPPIAAASIVAKVTRDDWLKKLSLKYPQYGFERHKGYPTKKHKQALLQFGPCPEHRKTFSGVKELIL